ncbi:MAG: hypothetical protein A3F70_04520 [Acidobacteria bacterium RIFCSPLOWO2_12_FULL_67_14]|nr:MAG: hypothetical protein A3H29_13505 [Acidobacteria bacterium RIFCSPLOWO2_02_FULL_67_21]OFW34975.1 MAG: hypothetical protein A3F70_04520 [Acidobacteria bacterium RIFCSPLOWO2_12_FULL_67_14]
MLLAALVSIAALQVPDPDQLYADRGNIASAEQAVAIWEERLTRDPKDNPDSTASRFFLAETLLDMNRRPEARAELEKVLDAPVDPDWAPEDQEFKAKARALLARLG